MPICLSCSNSTMSAECKRIGTKINDCIECHVLRKQFTSHKWWKWSRFSYLRALSAREHVCALHCRQTNRFHWMRFISPVLCKSLDWYCFSNFYEEKEEKNLLMFKFIAGRFFLRVMKHERFFLHWACVCVCVLFDSIFFLATTLLAVISYAKSTICVSCMVCVDLPPRFSITISK